MCLLVRARAVITFPCEGFPSTLQALERPQYRKNPVSSYSECNRAELVVITLVKSDSDACKVVVSVASGPGDAGIANTDVGSMRAIAVL